MLVVVRRCAVCRVTELWAPPVVLMRIFLPPLMATGAADGAVPLAEPADVIVEEVREEEVVVVIVVLAVEVEEAAFAVLTGPSCRRRGPATP